MDQILEEPTGGAHRNWDEMALTIKTSLVTAIHGLRKSNDLLSSRYNKFRRMGACQRGETTMCVLRRVGAMGWTVAERVRMCRRPEQDSSEI